MRFRGQQSAFAFAFALADTKRGTHRIPPFALSHIAAIIS